MRNCMYCNCPVKHFSFLTVLICLIATLNSPSTYAAGRRWIGNRPAGGDINSQVIDPGTYTSTQWGLPTDEAVSSLTGILRRIP